MSSEEDEDSDNSVEWTMKAPPPAPGQADLAPGYLRVLNTEFKMRDLNPFLTCSLCKGYLRDPHTVTECVHTFCKSCIFAKVHEAAPWNKSKYRNFQCPSPGCTSDLGAQPLKMLQPDKTVQQMMGKFFPDHEREHLEEEADFYRALNIPLKKQYRDKAGKAAREQKEREQERLMKKRAKHSKRVKQSEADTEVYDGPPLDCEIQLLPWEDGLDPGSQLPKIKKAYIRLSLTCVVGVLKDFLAPKVGVKATELEILCGGNTLGHEDSIRFVRDTLMPTDRRLVLHYRRKQTPS